MCACVETIDFILAGELYFFKKYWKQFQLNSVFYLNKKKELFLEGFESREYIFFKALKILFVQKIYRFSHVCLGVCECKREMGNRI